MKISWVQEKDAQSVEKHSALYIKQRMYGFRRHFLANNPTAICLEQSASYSMHLTSAVRPYLALVLVLALLELIWRCWLANTMQRLVRYEYCILTGI